MPGVRGMRPMGRRCTALGPGRGGYAVRPTSFAAGYRLIRCGRGCRGRGFRERWSHRAFFAPGFAWRQPFAAPVGAPWRV